VLQSLKEVKRKIKVSLKISQNNWIQSVSWLPNQVKEIESSWRKEGNNRKHSKLPIEKMMKMQKQLLLPPLVLLQQQSL